MGSCSPLACRKMSENPISQRASRRPGTLGCHCAGRVPRLMRVNLSPSPKGRRWGPAGAPSPREWCTRRILQPMPCGMGRQLAGGLPFIPGYESTRLQAGESYPGTWWTQTTPRMTCSQVFPGGHLKSMPDSGGHAFQMTCIKPVSHTPLTRQPTERRGSRRDRRRGSTLIAGARRSRSAPLIGRRRLHPAPKSDPG